MDVDLTDLGEVHHLTLSNGVLSHTTGASGTPADLMLRLPSTRLAALLTGQVPPDGLAAAGIATEGDLGTLARLMSVLDETDPDFAIVTP